MNIRVFAKGTEVKTSSKANLLSIDWQIQVRFVLWKKYPDKIEETKADAKWKEIEHMLSLDQCTSAVQAMGFFKVDLESSVG